MSQTLHIQKRGDVWHYCRRVPQHLVPSVGRGFIKKSLGVSDLTTAKRLRAIEDVKADALFSSLEKSHPSSIAPMANLAPVSMAMLMEHVRGTIAKLDRQSSERLALEPICASEELSAAKADIEIGIGILKNPSDPRRHDWVDHVAERELSQLGISSCDSAIFVQFQEVMRRGLLELQMRKLDRLDDRFGVVSHDVLFDPSKGSKISFGSLCEAFLIENAQKNKLNGTSEKWEDKIKAEVTMLREIVCDDTAVDRIDDDLVQNVRMALAAMPAHRTKRYASLTLKEAIQRCEADGREKLSSFTQKRYLAVFIEILKLGVRKKYLQYNPAADAQPLKKDTLSADKRRLPWDNEQIVKFFTGTFYRRCAPSALDAYQKRDRHWRFWLPLIMLFSGARPNEIAQLHFGDLKRTVSGTWYLDLVESEGEDDGVASKTLKTRSSRRRVPLHSELIRLGFVRFVNARKKRGDDDPRLFPEIKPDKYGNLATYPARRFREDFIPAEIELRSRQTFYSLRHNVRDALRRANASDESLRAIAGWSPHGKAVSDDYGDPGNPDFHAAIVEKIKYPGLDLSFLHVADEIGPSALTSK